MPNTQPAQPLHPCPFCGNNPSTSHGGKYAYCTNCNGVGGHMMLVEKWNTRAHLAPAPAVPRITPTVLETARLVKAETEKQCAERGDFPAFYSDYKMACELIRLAEVLAFQSSEAFPTEEYFQEWQRHMQNIIDGAKATVSPDHFSAVEGETHHFVKDADGNLKAAIAVPQAASATESPTIQDIVLSRPEKVQRALVEMERLLMAAPALIRGYYKEYSEIVCNYMATLEEEEARRLKNRWMPTLKPLKLLPQRLLNMSVRKLFYVGQRHSTEFVLALEKAIMDGDFQPLADYVAKLETANGKK